MAVTYTEIKDQAKLGNILPDIIPYMFEYYNHILGEKTLVKSELEFGKYFIQWLNMPTMMQKDNPFSIIDLNKQDFMKKVDKIFDYLDVIHLK